MRKEVFVFFDLEAIFDQNIFFFDVAVDVVVASKIDFFVKMNANEKNEVDNATSVEDNATSVEDIAIDVCDAVIDAFDVEDFEEDSS